MNNNMMLEFSKAMKNPQQYAINMLQSNPQIKNNPMIQNALQMAQQGNVNGVKQLAQNMAQTNGVDLSMFGIK